MKKILLLAALGGLAIWPPLAQAHEAHEHGAANINIAVEGTEVDIELESPLANMLPFEHWPSTEEERRQVRDLSARLHQAETLFKLTAAAECRLNKVELDTDYDDRNEHGDLDVNFEFLCAKPEKLNSVDVLLFGVWPKLEEIEIQAVTPLGQRAARLTPDKHLFSW
ncbi:MAG: DUF2796 domain-containing protein [Candidatus Adiutrix sp.]|jgi:hypothetical protein|nr:DUF2796 domain-containing protein [Candidatus Adiutrix sp.]